jgi:hypothetical protein
MPLSSNSGFLREQTEQMLGSWKRDFIFTESPIVLLELFLYHAHVLPIV